MTGLTVGYMEPSDQWATWTIDPRTGEGRLHYLRYTDTTEFVRRRRIWTGFGREPKTDERRFGDAKPEESNVPPDKRRVLCVRPFPYEAELRGFIHEKVAAAIAERDRMIAREWSK
ncbi:MAG: hypothetical protein HY791_31620 [Deltaproteobacteria bacterium]|nr:hypothetical protein [Deltaproteobacteria bacterium]